MRIAKSVARRRLWSGALALVTGVAGVTVGASPASAAPSPGVPAPLYTAGGVQVANQYIVVYRKGVTPAARSAAETGMRNRGGQLRLRFASVNGVSVTLSPAALAAVRLDPRVAYVEANRRVQAVTEVGSWGLDRIDQRPVALNSTYSYDSTGRGVHAYVIDTGVRLTHTEFAGRIGDGFDAVSEDTDGSDCHGHGTHVAGTVGGSTYGVAKQVTIHPVRMINCSGGMTIEDAVQGINWVTQNAQRPAVANMSFHAGGISQAIDDATRASVASGVTYAIAAANDNRDACQDSPGRVVDGITVGATTSTDARAGFSNWGACVDLFAPGQDIQSALNSGDGNAGGMSGTSMAAPHVAGVAAQFLQRHPNATARQVRDAIVDEALPGVVGSPGAGSPNLLLQQHVDAAMAVSDLTGDRRADVAVTGPAGWASLPAALSTGGGTFNVVNAGLANFPGWASTPGAKVIDGDFNADGRTDIALTGVNGWGSVPVAFATGAGTWNVTNAAIANFAGWTAVPGARVVSGDFNGDGRTDLAVTGVNGWGSLPVAFSNGNGSFAVTNVAIANFAGWTAVPGVEVVTGDFNADGSTDLAATGVNGWGSVPVAFSNGNGSFAVTNAAIDTFASWTAVPKVKVVTGDFNADGRTDVAVTGADGWGSLPVAFSNGNGSFAVTNAAINAFATFTAVPNVKVVTGDFNADGRTDVAATGPNGWASLPVAFSNGNGSFAVANNPIANFATFAATARTVVVGTPLTGQR